MKVWIKTVFGVTLALVMLTSIVTINAQTPEFSDELSRVGIRVEPDDTNAMELLSETGIPTIRYALNWHKFEPEKGQFDTKYIDDRISVLRNSHINSIVGIGVNNSLYSGKSDIRYGVESKENLDAFANYCKQLAIYLSENYPEIKTFLIWNEPNSASFWKDEPNPTAYYSLVKEASIAFKSIIPDCNIAAGVTANPSILFLTQLFELGIYDYADIITSQPYVTPSNADSNTLERRLISYSNLINEYGGFKDTYISEIGWNTTDTSGNGVSEDAQASNIIKTLVLADENDISGVNVYELIDGTGSGTSSENHFGLATSDYTPKSGLSALSYYSDYIGGADFAGKITDSSNTTFAYIYHKNGNIYAVAWTKNETATLSSVNLADFAEATDIYGNPLSAPVLSATPIYLKMNSDAPLHIAISNSISEYCSKLGGIESTENLTSAEISNMTAEDVLNKLKECYSFAFSLIENGDISLTSASDTVHRIGIKWGVLYSYLAQNLPEIAELSSDKFLADAKTKLESSQSLVKFTVKAKDVPLGDTITLAVCDKNGLPVSYVQKTIGSGIEPTLEFSLRLNGKASYTGKLSSYSTLAKLDTLTADNEKVALSADGSEFNITYEDTLDADLNKFSHSYPRTNAILKQAEKFNIQANTLKNSIYDSPTKWSTVWVNDFISSKLAQMAISLRDYELPNFDKGFSVITTPQAIKTSGTHMISAQISNRNSAPFNGYAVFSDNLGNIIDSKEISVPANAESTVDFILTLPETFDNGQYFYTISLTAKDTILAEKSIFINNQIGPYASAELTNDNMVESTPAENKFTLYGKEYILLDTTDNESSKFFVMEENIVLTKQFDSERYNIKFDPNNPDNIGYYLNNNYRIDETIKSHINSNHQWLTEAGYGDSVCPLDYKDTYGIGLLSVMEWNKYAGKFGYAPSGTRTNTWWMRTPGTNIDTIRYVSKVSGKSLHTTPDGEARGVRPVYYLDRDFFKSVKLSKIGANVLQAMKSTYTPQELLLGGAYSYAELVDMGIIGENDIAFTDITLKNSNGDKITSPENQQEITLSLTYGGDKEFKAILAVYDSNGILVACRESTGGTITEINLPLPAMLEEGSYAKCFIWENNNNLKPIQEPILFP